MAKKTEEIYVVIDFGITYHGLFMNPNELKRLKGALGKRPMGEGTIQIRYKPRPGSAFMTKMVVLDRIITITP